MIRTVIRILAFPHSKRRDFLVRSRWISDLHWVRPGQQTRSQKTQESLLDAAAVLVADEEERAIVEVLDFLETLGDFSESGRG